MTLAELLATNPDLATLRDRWLVLTPDLVARVAEEQEPNAMHRVEPVAIQGGNAVICADVLTERTGIFSRLWSGIDKQKAAAAEVIPTAQVQWLAPETP